MVMEALFGFVRTALTLLNQGLAVSVAGWDALLSVALGVGGAAWPWPTNTVVEAVEPSKPKPVAAVVPGQVTTATESPPVKGPRASISNGPAPAAVSVPLTQDRAVVPQEGTMPTPGSLSQHK